MNRHQRDRVATFLTVALVALLVVLGILARRCEHHQIADRVAERMEKSR